MGIQHITQFRKMKGVIMKHRCMITYLNGGALDLKSFVRINIRQNTWDHHPRLVQEKKEGREKVAGAAPLIESGTKYKSLTHTTLHEHPHNLVLFLFNIKILNCMIFIVFFLFLYNSNFYDTAIPHKLSNPSAYKA